MSEPTSCYIPLDRASSTIRLLYLSPEPHPIDNRIQCSLVVAPLDSATSYEALSYTWGQPDDFNFRIWLNDALVSVRRNLLMALRVLRANEHRVLWIDALCINQDDLTERGHQVEMMGDIYRNADCVLSWLGTPDASEKRDLNLDTSTEEPARIEVLAFNLLELIAKEVKTFWPTRAVSASRSQPCIKWWRENFARNWSLRPHFRQLGDLCFDGYWSRVWIIQEVCLAQRLKLLYGRRTVEWDTFTALKSMSAQRVVSIASRTGNDWDADIYIQASQPWKLEDLRCQRRNIDQGEENELQDLLELSRHCRCQLRLDKVYGVLGLASDAFRAELQIDYAQSLYELYCKVMKVFMRRNPHPDRILWFNNLLQRSLLYPDPEPQIFTSLCRGGTEFKLNDFGNRSIRIKGRSLGSVLLVGEFRRPAASILAAARSRWDLLDARSSQNLGDCLENRASQWDKVIENLASEDRSLSSHFHYHKTGTKSVLVTGEVREGLAQFVADTGIVGICSKGIRVGDVIWGYSGPFKMFGIARGQEKRRSELEPFIISKAILAHRRLIVKRIDGNTKESLYLPHPHFGSPIFEEQEKGRIYQIRLGLRVLQTLTCPTQLINTVPLDSSCESCDFERELNPTDKDELQAARAPNEWNDGDYSIIDKWRFEKLVRLQREGTLTEDQEREVSRIAESMRKRRPKRKNKLKSPDPSLKDR